jgi:hypothetical protein
MPENRALPQADAEWLGLGSELLAQLGCDPQRFSRQVVGDFLQPSCVDVAVEELHGRLEGGRTAEESEQERGARLGINRVTIYRWRPGHPDRTTPRLDKYLTAALSLKLAIPGLSYPASAIRVAKETMCRIHRELLRQVPAQLSDQEFSVVHLFVSDPDSFALFTGEEAASRGQLQNIYRRILHELKERFPRPTITTSQQVTEVLNRWLHAYLLFLRAMVDAEWEFLHEESGEAVAPAGGT